MQGKIVKGIAGFYYVNVEGQGIYVCRAKGNFRNRKIKPLVGDDVELELVSQKSMEGNIIDILPRRNELIRPAVSNVDQAVIIFAMKEPEPNLNLLDRFIIMMNKQNVETIICFNKTDKGDSGLSEQLANIYKDCGCKVLFTSALLMEGTEQISELIKNKTTVLAGPSGVGKSTIINLMHPEANMETGAVSDKIKRGKNTTRHTELFYTGLSTYILDTPGFSSLYIDEIDKEELKKYFVEFHEYEGKCKFQGCMHINEPECAVKTAISEGKIPLPRYESYKYMYEELAKQKKY